MHVKTGNARMQHLHRIILPKSAAGVGAASKRNLGSVLRGVAARPRQ
jgi:hypothetical protein